MQDRKGGGGRLAEVALDLGAAFSDDLRRKIAPDSGRKLPAILVLPLTEVGPRWLLTQPRTSSPEKQGIVVFSFTFTLKKPLTD